MQILYVDEIFLINLVINFVLLYLTAKIVRLHISILRLICGSVLASIYTILMILPDLGFMYTFLGKLVFSFLLITVSYKFQRLFVYMKLLLVFYAVTFAFGGFVYACLGILHNSNLINCTIDFGTPLNILIFSTIASYILLSNLGSYVRRIKCKDKCIRELIIEKNGHKIRLKCLMDTGNSLYEPFTHIPIVVVYLKSLRPIFPKKLFDLLCDMTKFDDILHNQLIEYKFRIISFTSVGVRQELMAVFKPDKMIIKDIVSKRFSDIMHKNVTINENVHEKVISNILVGISHNHLCSDNTFEALINPEILSN